MMDENKQAIFDKVATHLGTQRSKAWNSLGECVYRASDGKKCAAGCLISDEHYSPDLERCSARASSVEKAVRDSLGYPLTPMEMDLITILQGVHDNDDVPNWPNVLRSIADNLKLDTSVLDSEVFADWPTEL